MKEEERKANIENGCNYGPYSWNRSDSDSMLDDDELKKMSKPHANLMLNDKNKARWVKLHNATANLYFIKKGQIEDVPPQGWWY